MKHITFFIIAICTLFVYSAHGQIQYKIELLPDNETYQVSMVPMVDWGVPFNKVSTAQVTIKTPATAFEPTDFVNLQENVVWESNSRYDAPDEAPDFDYITFGLVSLGTSGLTFNQGVEVPLFQFKNALGCTGAVMLVNNEADDFLPPNSRKANIGNEMTVFGARGNAYTGVAGTGEVNCLISSAEDIAGTDVNLEANIFPNPASREMAVTFNWQLERGTATFVLRNSQGQAVISEQSGVEKGTQVFRLDIEHLPNTIYQLELFKDGKRYTLGKLVKAE